MAKFYDLIDDEHQRFIEAQSLFFVATAANTGTVNVSPKGLDSLRVLNPTKVIWYNLTGSGNETAAHVLNNARMTLMFCAFNGKPLIYRVSGSATMYQPDDKTFDKLSCLFNNCHAIRQIFELDVTRTISSCGSSIPFYEFQGERTQLTEHWAGRSAEEIRAYQREKNTTSFDGLNTGILS